MSPTFKSFLVLFFKKEHSWLFVLLTLSAFPAHAGPPFVTDDPEPPELNQFEINIAAQLNRTDHMAGAAVPNLDINYGAGPDTQLHLSLTAALQSVDGQSVQAGDGDTELGVKYRFVEEDEDGWHPQIGVFPLLELPSGDASRGLGAGHVRAYLPVWVQKSVGDWLSFGGGGYWIDRGQGSRDHWFAGWALLRRFDEHWTLGGELFWQSADLRSGAGGSYGNGVSDQASAGFNLGGYYIIDDGHQIMFSAGRGFLNAASTNQFSGYLGLKLLF